MAGAHVEETLELHHRLIVAVIVIIPVFPRGNLEALARKKGRGITVEKVGIIYNLYFSLSS